MSRKRNEAFDRMEEVNKEVAGMTPSAQGAYRDWETDRKSVV